MSITITGSTNTVTSSAATINISKGIAVTGDIAGTTLASVAIDTTTNKPVTAASLNGGTLPASVTTLSAGVITSTVTSGNLFTSSSGTTNQLNIKLTNTGGTSYFGINSSTGGFLTGGNAYNAFILGPNNNSYGIDFGTGTANTRRMTIDGAGLVTMLNGLGVTGAITATTTLKSGGYTVATLPAGTTGERAYVTDATAPTYLGALTGGGAVVCPVFKNASAWVSA